MADRGDSVREEERRRHPRHPVRLRVLFQQGELTLFLEAEADDISEGGLRIRTRRRPPDVGTELTLLVSRPDGELMLRGVVRWTADSPPEDEDALQAMGIELIDTDEPTRARFRSILKGLEP